MAVETVTVVQWRARRDSSLVCSLCELNDGRLVIVGSEQLPPHFGCRCSFPRIVTVSSDQLDYATLATLAMAEARRRIKHQPPRHGLISRR